MGLGIGMAFFLILGISYRVARHSYELTDEVTIFKKTASINWQDIEVLPEDRGLVILTPLVASTEISNGTPPKGITPDIVHVTGDDIHFINLQSNNTIDIDSDLVSRQITNRFGSQILS